MKKVILVILDACQYQAATKNFGFLEHMVDVEKGAKYKVKGELPSISRSMYTTILTGVQAWEHGITCNEVVKKTEYENVFSIVKKNGGVTAAAAYSWMSELYNHCPFDPMNDRIQNSDSGSIKHGIFYWDDNYPDSHLFADGEYLRNTYQPDFLLYHSMAIDQSGHVFGSGSKEYETAVSAAGNILAYLLPKWLKDGYQVVITADHGMNDLGIHGGTEADQRDVPLYIFSPEIVNGHFEDYYISQLNIAPLLCRLLEIEPSGSMLNTLEIQ